MKAKFKSSTSLYIFHLNIYSIQFDIIAIPESKLNCQPIVNINLKGYHSPCSKLTEANKGGTLL